MFQYQAISFKKIIPGVVFRILNPQIKRPEDEIIHLRC